MENAQTYPHDLVLQRRRDIKRIIESHGCTEPRLFGSAARGDDRADSDIDIIVVPDEQTSLAHFASIYSELKQLLGIEIELVSVRQLPQERKEAILAESIVL